MEFKDEIFHLLFRWEISELYKCNEKGPFEWEMLKIQEEEKRWAEALKGWERDEALSR